MSTEFAIRACDLSKQYRIGVRCGSYKTLRESLMRVPKRAFNAAKTIASAGVLADETQKKTFWALKGLNFEIKKGEKVGVIGHNGAGKSTLLKILSRITEPTRGYVDLNGRVGSLLEVGTGFHPELTGRENIFLNGAILGMGKLAIEDNFDTIVEFAGVENFIETPVKHYSSGMYLRLAFAVAAHLNPDILLVDEVLAVGDVRFQKKCLGKMGEVAREGRTVVFVSHNLGALKELCDSCIVLNNGEITYFGNVLGGIAHYTEQASQVQFEESGRANLLGDILVNGSKEFLDQHIGNSEKFSTKVTLQVKTKLSSGRLICILQNSNGDDIVHISRDLNELCGEETLSGAYDLTLDFPPTWLVPDAYSLFFKVGAIKSKGENVRLISERAIVSIVDSTGQMNGKVRSVIFPPVEWEARKR